MTANDLQRQIIAEFGSAITQQLYIQAAEQGLRSAEQTLIEQYFQPGSAILDIGCGTGRTSIALAQQGYRVTGVDITPAMIINARRIAAGKGLAIHYDIGDATQLPYASHAFDHALFSFNGWTQIPGADNRLLALREVYRVLKPGGRYLFSSQTRTMKGFRRFWTQQWIRLHLLKPLGVPVAEVDFGDRFFTRPGSQQQQFIHIPALHEVKAQIDSAGFHLLYCGKMHAPGEAAPPPTYYVCEKV